MGVLKKIVSILELLSRERSLGTIEIANKLDLPKSTVNRILKELMWYGLLEQNEETKKYGLGWKLIQLASKYYKGQNNNYYIPLIKTFMQELVEETKDTIYLCVMKQNRVICISKVDGKSNLRFFAEVGKEFPLNCSAPAKVLLSHQPNDIQMDIVDNMEYVRFTDDSIIEKEIFIEELDRTKRNGYGVCDNEIEIGSSAVAVPIFDEYGSIIASLALVGTREHVEEDFDHIITSMKEASDMITNQLVNKDIINF